MPQLFVDLLDAHLDAPALTRILTVLSDAMTARLLELAVERHGEPPVAYAWLAFGSTARSELTLASDQDNGLAYADTDDPAVDEYFRLVAEEVNDGLRRCGFSLDPHGTVARNWQWRLPLSMWCKVFSRSLEGTDLDRLARASVAFDFRQVAGDLAVVPPLTDIIREAPRASSLPRRLARLGTGMPLAAGLSRSAHGLSSTSRRTACCPIQNLARYYAFASGITAPNTLERLVAVREDERAGHRVDPLASRGLRQHVAPPAAPPRQRHPRRPAPRQHDQRGQPAPADPGHAAGGAARGRHRAASASPAARVSSPEGTTRHALIDSAGRPSAPSHSCQRPK